MNLPIDRSQDNNTRGQHVFIYFIHFFHFVQTGRSDIFETAT